ncbi:MAG: endonuclease/exonuclease/phosphatase family metal-dependent hydrolase [bacterium]|jgi:endonuclease/exonuclease/phosphatase family metal-dependent hydrolase
MISKFTISFLLMSTFFLNAQIEELSFGTEDTFEIMTWNIEHFPKNGQTTVNYVSEIIEALDVDLIAIQEVENVNYFEQMVGSLSSYNGYLESSWFAGLAYIYNPEVIEINDIYEIYTSSQYWSSFPRAPMVMDLNYLNNRIIVINNHLKCCGDGNLDITNSNDEETRRYQANLLLKEFIDSNFPNENVIMLGDLNDDITDAPQNNVFQMFLNEFDNYLFTDIDIASGSSSNWSYPSWPSHLDHIMITNELFDEFEHIDSEIATIKIDEYLTNGWSEYDENISDHRPVGLKLKIDLNLDINDISNSNLKFYNTPNPFQSETILNFNSFTEIQEIEIFNINGQKVSSIKNLMGKTSIKWNAEGFPNGIYIAKLIRNNYHVSTTKIVLMN